MRKLLKFFFYHFYHSFAWTYDSVAALVSMGRWLDWTRAAFPFIVGPRVLEVGFGPGHLQVELNKQGFDVIGLDESGQMVNLARISLKKQHLPLMLLRGVAQNLPLKSVSVDSILSCFPTEYIFDSRTLAEIFRVLKPFGRLIVVPAAWISGQSIRDRAARWLFRFTGQTPQLNEDFEKRISAGFIEAGFVPKIEYIHKRESTVMIIIAEKPDTHPR